MLPIIIIEAVGLVLIVLTAFFILIFGQKTEVIRLEGNTIEEEEISPVAIAVAMIILGKINQINLTQIKINFNSY